MYVKQESIVTGIGGKRIKKAMEEGKILGYERMRLDTLAIMQTAISLYRKMGFYEMDTYRFNPIPGAKFFEVVLKD